MKKAYMRTIISRRDCVLITLFQLNESPTIGGRTNPILICIQLKYIYLTQYYYLTYFQVKKTADIII